MIAITPMPPTISAIERDHDQREERRLADLIPHLQDRVLRRQVEVVRLVELQVVADAHHRFDLAHRLLAHASRAARRRSSPCGTAGLKLPRVILPTLQHLAVELLVRRVRDHDEVVAPPKPPGSAACRARR
jgi:hypothetical protein